jgi:hypothetical protein
MGLAYRIPPLTSELSGVSDFCMDAVASLWFGDDANTEDTLCDWDSPPTQNRVPLLMYSASFNQNLNVTRHF